jgi:DNA invertase Pin-like site-specific DNA recombinase
MKIGYARVSTTEQDLSGQLAALKEAGCKRVYSEKKSGANSDRAALKRMLKEVQSGDIVVVTRLDARTYGVDRTTICRLQKRAEM